ncbi:ParB/RepB/Spo0J family partition protein [Loktanella salsilacus]|jgi:ParB family chromosome partitioning protein|uniref:ParB/RepB/Spo0J family partition protein n=1 Tax=Loktanella salsilacus TaxID=195913 RepID=UPI0020B794C1|nr:ParB/RepB/Spo0J family partition protein [Loktanella salsilacus]UTH48108.1 ParB/RepB/Spo0J family partition protein [Loktanella salsilacus]
MATPPKSRGLGRGLSALMADVAVDQPSDTTSAPRRADMMVPVERIRPNPDQPRRTFEPNALSDLADSIREKGVIQPLIVRVAPEDPNLFEIVAGERRWRASQMAQLHELPVLIRDFNDTEVLEIAIIENIQRADLNPVDEAAGYRQLMDRFGHTQEQLATALGKSRSHIANQMRLLQLPSEVLDWLSDGKLTAGHARTLVGHPDAKTLAQQIIGKQMSVREAERLTKKGPAAGRSSSQPRNKEKDPDTVMLERELSAALGMGVTIDHAAGQEGGKLTISYKTLAQLDDLMRQLTGD